MRPIYYTSIFILFSLSSLNSQIINTITGNGIAGYSGDGGIALSAQIDYPKSICFDPSQNMYIADWSNFRIRKIDINGNITTFAGTGIDGYTGDNGLAISANIGAVIHDIVSDSIGNIYFTDYAYDVVRKINTNGIISTIAGTGIEGHSGDGNLAIYATLENPVGIAIDKLGNIYIGENECIRKITPNGIITTIAGSANATLIGNGGPAILADINLAKGLIIDSKSNIYFSDHGHNQIRKINTNGTIDLVAGTGNFGYSGDNGLATMAKLNGPCDITFDKFENLYISDFHNNVIRKIDTLGIIQTVIGNGFNAGTGLGSFSGDGGPAINAGLYRPTSISIDNNGNFYVCDMGNSRIRKISSITHIKEQSNNSNITIYPNPTSDFLNISNLSLNHDSKDLSLKVNIYNSLGEKVFLSDEKSLDSKLNVSSFAPGIYYIEIQGITKKFIKL